jgi:DNA relaxase NicK
MELEIYPKRSPFFLSQSAAAPVRTPLVGEAGAAATPPLLPSTPTANRGVTEGQDAYLQEDYTSKEDFKVVAVGTGSKLTLIRIPVALESVHSTVSFIDWLNFSFKKHDYFTSVFSAGIQEYNPNISIDTEMQIVSDLSRFLTSIFGYGVIGERTKGLYFYQRAFDLADSDKNWGQVCIGGQNDSVLVSLTAQGLLAAKSGWEQRLYDFVTRIPNAKITRIDLAHDAFNSPKSLEDYFQMYLADLFSLTHSRPSVEQRGDWVNDVQQGRTLYVGKRLSGKFLRIYEKGKQLGGGFSMLYPDWVRVELELHNTQRDIPLDVLLKPGAYLAGSYPALKNILSEQCSIDTKKKSAKLTVDRLIEVTRHQFGRYFHFISSLFGIEQAFQILTYDKEQIPKRLDTDDYSVFDPQVYLTNAKVVFNPDNPLLAINGGDFLDYGQFRDESCPF